MVALSKGVGVFLSAQQLSWVTRAAQDKPAIMIRKLMDCLFDLKTLSEGCAIGARNAHNHKGIQTKALDDQKIRAIKGIPSHDFGFWKRNLCGHGCVYVMYLLYM